MTVNGPKINNLDMPDFILSREAVEKVKLFNGHTNEILVHPQIKNVKKRDGRIVSFDILKVANAAYKGMLTTNEGDETDALKIAKAVYLDLITEVGAQKNFTPEVEHIQDLVEKALILGGFVKTAKQYILYRKEHADLRAKAVQVSPEVKKKFEESRKYFRNPLSELVYYRTYARWIEKEGRRETWVETVTRFMDFMKEKLGKKLSNKEYAEVEKSIVNQETIPSMRLVWAAGPAARATEVACYNCAFIAPTTWHDFSEILYIQMCGTGVGFSVESEIVQQLPMIKRQTGKVLRTHVVVDSREGWAEAFRIGLETWAGGRDIHFDFSKIRPLGSRLRTMGGIASGPTPLRDLLRYAREKILTKQGRRLSNIEVHDIICKSGEIVVAGGVRRSSLISLSDLDDEQMRDAKRGQFFYTNPERSMANNSAVYNHKPSAATFLDEWVALAKSGTGERGIFNRGSFEHQIPERRIKKNGPYMSTFGINPCGEIILRSKQFCNLTSIVARAEDKKADLMRKVRVAALLGTYQATLTNFPYLSKEWKKNCEDEALLGVSITGYWDNKVIRNEKVLREARDLAVKTNKIYAKRFKINPSTAVTCIKPSGNSSQFLDTASGMHPRFAHYYIRRVRINVADPLLRMMMDQGIPAHPEVGQSKENATTYVLEFPVEAPADAIVKDDLSAIELLEHWKLIKTNFTEHNPSATIYVGDDEWLAVANWVYSNWDIIGGLSFLPRDNHVYQLAPYEEIDKNTYKELASKISNLDFSKLVLYENDDNTFGAKEAACVAGGCDI